MIVSCVQTMKAFEDILEPLPFGAHHIVFVDEAYADVSSFAGMSIIRSGTHHCIACP